MFSAKNLLDFLLELPTDMSDSSPQVRELVLALPFPQVLESDSPDLRREVQTG